MTRKKRMSKPKNKPIGERLPKMSQQIMTSELAWGWIAYATRAQDARERIGEIPRPQLLTLAELLERSPIVNPTRRKKASDRKPKMKQGVCKCCGVIFEYDGSRGRNRVFKNDKHQQRWHNHQKYLRRKSRQKVAKQRQKVLKGIDK